MFGFKGQTPGSIPGLAAGALMMHATRSLFGGAKNAVAGGKGGSGSSGSNSDNIKFSPDKGDGYNDEGLFGKKDNSGGSTEELDDERQRLLEHQSDIEEEGKETPSSSSGSGGIGGSSGAGGSSGSTKNHEYNPKQVANTNNINNDSNDGVSGNKINEWALASKRALKNKVKGTIGDGSWRKEQLKAVGKTTARVVLGAGLGAAGAAAGGIATMISGDPSKALENISVGGLAGYKLGSSREANLSASVGGAVDAVKEEYYSANPDKYQKKMQDEFVKNFKKDNENMRSIERNFTNKKEYDEMVNNGINEYTQYGITDVKEMIRAEKFYKANNDIQSRKQAINVMQMKKKIAGGDYTKLHLEDKQKWEKDMYDKFKKAGYSSSKARENVQKAVGYFEQIDKMRID